MRYSDNTTVWITTGMKFVLYPAELLPTLYKFLGNIQRNLSVNSGPPSIPYYTPGYSFLKQAAHAGAVEHPRTMALELICITGVLEMDICSLQKLFDLLHCSLCLSIARWEVCWLCGGTGSFLQSRHQFTGGELWPIITPHCLWQVPLPCESWTSKTDELMTVDDVVVLS